jgi:hypothetical protein
VDFYHASEYIWDAGNAEFGRETDAAQTWGEKQCHLLKHSGPDTILETLRTLGSKKSNPPELVTKAITYFENQGKRT